jgi:mannose-P-dolichol utilization defect protein 1
MHADVVGVVHPPRARARTHTHTHTHAHTHTNALTHTQYPTGNSFTTWGENIFLLMQVVIILSLMLHYSGRHGMLALSLAVVAGFMVPACTGRVPEYVLAAMMASGIPITIASKVSTIATVVRGKTTGQLALVTSLLNAFGASARIFTTLQEVDDNVILAGYMSAAAMNWAIVSMFVLYPRSAAPAGEKKKQ